MRNWNLASPPVVDSDEASRLPMRNWNLYVPEGPESKDNASRLPMRNWNVFVLVSIALLGCFQTTYEELKLSWSYNLYKGYASRLPMRNWNDSPRRSILVLVQLPDYLWGIETVYRVLPHGRQHGRFQTTYEELKQGTTYPIREYTWLPDYLWGIETELVLKHPLPDPYGFQTTYEELKLI